MRSGNKPADIPRELARWIAYQRERAHFEGEARAELRRAVAAWQERGGPAGQTPDEYLASIERLAGLGLVTFTVTPRRGRPYTYDPATWPQTRARAVAKIQRRRAGDNYPSRKRIAVVLGIGERTVYNYDRALGPPQARQATADGGIRKGSNRL